MKIVKNWLQSLKNLYFNRQLAKSIEALDLNINLFHTPAITQEENESYRLGSSVTCYVMKDKEELKRKMLLTKTDIISKELQLMDKLTDIAFDKLVFKAKRKRSHFRKIKRDTKQRYLNG